MKFYLDVHRVYMTMATNRRWKWRQRKWRQIRISAVSSSVISTVKFRQTMWLSKRCLILTPYPLQYRSSDCHPRSCFQDTSWRAEYCWCSGYSAPSTIGQRTAHQAAGRWLRGRKQRDTNITNPHWQLTKEQKRVTAKALVTPATLHRHPNHYVHRIVYHQSQEANPANLVTAEFYLPFFFFSETSQPTSFFTCFSLTEHYILGRSKSGPKALTCRLPHIHHNHHNLVVRRARQKSRSYLGLQAACTSGFLGRSYLELAQSPVNSRTRHENCRPRQPVG